MAMSQTFTLEREDLFPPGTAVDLYRVTGWPPSGGTYTGPPPGGAVTSSTVDVDGLLTFTSLADDTNYVAFAGTPDRYIRFRTNPSLGSGGSGGTSVGAFDALTDVDASAPSDGDGIYWNAGLASWAKRKRQVFDVRDYGAALDGVADDRPALAAAYAAAAVGGGIVYLGPGTLRLNSSATGSMAIPWSAFQGGHVVIRGAGKLATKIQLTTGCRTLVGPAHGYNSNGSIVYKDFSLEDFTVDCNNIAAGSSANGGVLLHFGGRCSFERLSVRRVDTINVGGLAVSGDGRANIGLTIFCDAYTQGPFHATDMLFEDCYFGRSGGGGNYGILLQAFAQNQGTSYDQMTRLTATGGIANCSMDRVFVNRCVYDSGDVVPAGVQAYSSSGFMFGSHALGGRLRIRDCHAANSVDDGFEVNSWYDALLDGCTARNCPQEGFYFVNLGGMPQPERQVIRVHNCGVIRDASLGASTTVNAFAASYKRGAPHGELRFTGCYQVGDRSGATKYPPQAMAIVTDFRKLVIKDHTISGYNYLTWTANSQSINGTGVMRIGNTSGKGVVVLENIAIDMTYVLDRGAFTGATFTAEPIQIDVASDLTIKARNIDPRIKVIQAQAADDPTPSSYTSCRVRGIGFALTNGGSDANYQNSIYTAAADLSPFVYDAGVQGDLTATDTGIQVSGTPASEKRWHSLYGGLTYPGWGPHTDLVVWSEGVTPSTLTDFKLIAGIKGLQGADRFSVLTRYIECYLTDDGTNSFLCIDKVYDGVRTSLLGTIGTTPAGESAAITAISTPLAYQSDRGILLPSRLTAASSVWVRGQIQDRVLKAEYLSSVPALATITGGTVVASTGTVTLTDADAQVFGDGVQGWPFQGIVAKDSTARLTQIAFTRRHVIRGHIEGYTFPSGRSPVKNWSAYKMGKDDTLLRFALDLRHDLGRLAADPSIMDVFESSTATHYKGIRVMPGAITKNGRAVNHRSHPDMVDGIVLGGNSGTSFTIDVGGADYWFEQRTLTANTVVAIQNVAPGGCVDLELIQDGVGGRTVILVAPGGTIGSTTPGAGAGDKSFVSIYTPDGINFRVITSTGL